MRQPPLVAEGGHRHRERSLWWGRGFRGHDGLDACGGVTESAAGALDQVSVLLLRVPLEEGCPLERPELGLNADRSEVREHVLAQRGEGGVAVVLARVEPV